MKTPRTLALAATIAAMLAPLHATVDLTPNPSTYEVEGLRFPCVIFRDGTQRIQYTPPAGWQVSGGGARLKLSPADSSQADVIVEILPGLSDPAAADAGSTLGRLASAVIPRDAEKVENVGTAVNPLRIEKAGTIEFTLRYIHYGVSYQSSVLLMRRGSDLWRFTLTARAGDFQRMHEAYRNSLYSLQTLR